jgi:ankyrin repeat protein
MPSLPERASLEWLRKTAKQTLIALRAAHPQSTLADAQLAVAREYGFSSWRALKKHVDEANAAAAGQASEAMPPGDGETRDHTVQRFLRLVATGPIDAIRMLLVAQPGLVNVIGPHPFWGGRPQPLHVAIESGRADVFELLLDAGADVSGDNEAYDRWSPLMLAVQRGRDTMRDALLARGARVGLVEALMLGDDAKVEQRLAEGASALEGPGIPNSGSILMFARTPFAVERLLALGAPAGLRDRWGAAAVDAFGKLGARGAPLVAQLAAHGVPVPIAVLARLGDRPALEAALARDPDGVRADDVLLAAIDGGHHAIVEWLLAEGARANARASDRSRHTALHEAAWKGDLRMAQILVAAGADVTARDEEHTATPRGWAETSIEITRNPACAAVADWLAGIGG